MNGSTDPPTDPAAPLLLVVGDHGPNPLNTAQTVREAGYRVAQAATGQAALDLCRRLRPDLVLVDGTLRDMSGFEICRRLRTEAEFAPVHVVEVSGTVEPEAERARESSDLADAYLTEPVDGEALLQTIAWILRVRRAELSLASALERERQARDETDRANRFTDEFLATLSHELRTPLSTIVGWIWQLRHGITDETAKLRALDALERSANMQARVINDLLDVSRLGHGDVELELALVDLSVIIESALEAVHSALTTKQILVTVSTTPVAIVGDGSRLEQIIGNLLTNAIKCSLPNGRIDVSLTLADGAAVIRVRDTGVGIDAKRLPHIFEQFHQSDNGVDRRHAGFGLRLAVVRQLVTQHNGTVIAESEGPGQGATFTIRLPLARTPDVMPTPAAAPADQTLHGMHILVVDDDHESLAWLARLVESRAGVATAVDSPYAALAALNDRPVDAIVSDIDMPGMDGLLLLQMVRGRGFTMPAIAVTAYSAAEERRRILAAGFDTSFSKPIDPSVFLARLATLVRTPAGRLVRTTS